MRIRSFLLSTLVVLVAATAPARAAGPDFVGTWVLTAADKLLPDGTRADDYGANPHGLAVFTADGHYSISVFRAERRKFVSGDRAVATLDEYRDAMLTMSTHFGRYTVDATQNVITFEVDRASFPNWDDSKRPYPFDMKGDEVSWKGLARPDGSIPLTVFRRLTH